AQPVVRERDPVEQVPETIVEAPIAVVRDHETAVFDAKRIGVVLAERMTGDLRRPAIEAPAVEKLDPLLALLRRHRRARERRDQPDPDAPRCAPRHHRPEDVNGPSSATLCSTSDRLLAGISTT